VGRKGVDVVAERGEVKMPGMQEKMVAVPRKVSTAGEREARRVDDVGKSTRFTRFHT
jgi:hypothetical protein